MTKETKATVAANEIAILTLPEAADRPRLAKHLVDTGIGIGVAKGILAAAAKEHRDGSPDATDGLLATARKIGLYGFSENSPANT